MLKKWFLSSIFLLSATSAPLQGDTCYNCYPGIFAGGLFCPENYLQVGIGYRWDKADWSTVFPFSIKSDGLVELFEAKTKVKLENQEYLFLGVKGQIPVGVAYVRGEFNYGWGDQGTARQRLEDPLLGTFEISNGFKGSHIVDGVIAVGYPVYYLRGNLRITPTCGASYYRQRMITKNSDRFAIGEFDAPKRDKYRLEWWGPWLGVDLAYTFLPMSTVYSELEFNLRSPGRCERKQESSVGIDELRRRSDRDRAHGMKIRLGLSWSYLCYYYADINWTYHRWSCGNKDKVVWESNSTMVSWGRFF